MKAQISSKNVDALREALEALAPFDPDPDKHDILCPRHPMHDAGEEDCDCRFGLLRRARAVLAATVPPVGGVVDKAPEQVNYNAQGKCPRCGGEFTQLTPDEPCGDCRGAGPDQLTPRRETLPEELDDYSELLDDPDDAATPDQLTPEEAILAVSWAVVAEEAGNIWTASDDAVLRKLRSLAGSGGEGNDG